MSQSHEIGDDFSIPLEMQRTYWERRQLDFEKLEQALQSETIDVFHKIGHQIKGNAVTFGFEELSPLGERMEDMQSAEFFNLAPLLLTEFKIWIKKTESRFISK